VCFAYVESAVVEYLRALYYPINSGGFAFPLHTLSQLQAMGNEHITRLTIEFGRELATLAMLGAVGLTAGRNLREAMAHFMIAFGVWDIFYYIWLRVFLGWPEGIMTWDLLFLVPVPWVAPVLAPVIISVAMIAAGLTVLFFESRGLALKSTWSDWIFIAGGGLVVIASFCLDCRNIMNGGFPNPFNWPVFIAGLGVSSAAFVLALRRNLIAR
jgi:hypothetical protein